MVWWYFNWYIFTDTFLIQQLDELEYSFKKNILDLKR